MGPADYIGSNCGMDVFIPTYRLAPESDIHDLLWDVALAYRWLYLLKQKRDQDPTKIVLFGCSSGAALCTRLMQFFAELERGEELLPSYIAPLLSDIKMPAAGVLASPYVDYRPPSPDGSLSAVQSSRFDGHAARTRSRIAIFGYAHVWTPSRTFTRQSILGWSAAAVRVGVRA